MRRGLLALALATALAAPAAAAPPKAPPKPATLEIRVDGKVFRKSSGKLVLSLSAYEIGKDRFVTLENRKTKERRKVPLSSVYEDLSYSDPLPEEEYAAFEPDEWTPFVTWRIEESNEGLNDRLTSLHEEQNRLRRQVGQALLEDGGDGESKVTSRVTLNKIEKYHHLATVLARRILAGWNREETNPFLFPVRIQVAFNPFGRRAGAMGNSSPVQQAREVMFWEVNRVLSQQYEVPDALIDLAYNSPPTIRQIVPIGELSREEVLEFAPTVFLSSETLDGVVYIERQGFFPELREILRTKQFLSPFVTDRPVLDALLNEGRVAGVEGGRAAVSFIPPFMKRGETVWLVLAEGDEVAVTLEESLVEEGYTRTSPLPPGALARVKPGMTVRRKK